MPWIWVIPLAKFSAVPRGLVEQLREGNKSTRNVLLCLLWGSHPSSSVFPWYYGSHAIPHIRLECSWQRSPTVSFCYTAAFLLKSCPETIGRFFLLYSCLSITRRTVHMCRNLDISTEQLGWYSQSITDGHACIGGRSQERWIYIVNPEISQACWTWHFLFVLLK